MNVSVTIPTRGDVDLTPVIASFPTEWEILVWDNGAGTLTVTNRDARMFVDVRLEDQPDLSVYGRYAAIEYATHDLILTQDDDVIVSDPQAIVDELVNTHPAPYEGMALPNDFFVANMPQSRPHYPDSCLVGFGACFHRGLPQQAFKRVGEWRLDEIRSGKKLARTPGEIAADGELFHRECDAVFTALTPRVLVDVPKQDREFASDPNRLWKQPGHFEARTRMLEIARQVRDA